MLGADVYRELQGYETVLAWFDAWPSFHDAEITQISLSTHGDSSLEVATWRTRAELDSGGFYARDKEAVVVFHMSAISSVELSGFSPQNVIAGLIIVKQDRRIRLLLEPCYGVSGYIEAQEIRVEVRPGASRSY